MHSIKTPVYQTQQIREFERLAIEQFGITGSTMMQRAGEAAFEYLLHRFKKAQTIAVFCGGGNNGGDGYVLAHLAHEHGLKVTIWQVGSMNKMKEEARNALLACQKAHIPMYPFDEEVDLQRPDLIVDAICGIGLEARLRENIVTAIEKMHQTGAPILAIDIPTGIHADTGQVLGAAVRAHATITFIGLKLGLLTGNGIAYTGELICNDLNLPAKLFSMISPIAEKVQLDAYSSYLKARSRDWHKGLSGHVLVVGGALGFSGAARMAAEAALRVGAGLVSVATRPEHATVLNVDCPEIMCHGVTTVEQFDPLMARADVIILGPGLGQSSWAKMLWSRVCETSLPLVVDADGLNLLSETSLKRDDWVLTPHPGEASRLLHMTVTEVQQDRLAAIKAITKRYHGVAVLKGAGSLILAPNSLPVVCDKGNPGMASAGMGDILSGVLGGLIAQGVPLGDAAKMGVYLHAMAGDLAAKEGERGMIAMDLMPYLRQLVNAG